MEIQTDVIMIIIIIILTILVIKKSENLSKELLNRNLPLKPSSKPAGKHQERDAKIASLSRYIPAESPHGKTDNHPKKHLKKASSAK